MEIADKLALNKFSVDTIPHLKIDQEKCHPCPHKNCTLVCPVSNYTQEGDRVVLSWEGCLECGTCRIACDQGSLQWQYPRGGFGIAYRLG
ncbi:MAG: 4Fe-4S dicluster domain-containing protein [Chloroflexi bacterium]|nr:4Fe-4S dicluster domain-containing protein [Chloroflexota bacterium]